MHIADWLPLRRPWGDRPPDVVGEIRAWRVWLACTGQDGEPVLRSYYADLIWPPGEVVRAECRRRLDQIFHAMGTDHPGEPPPARSCTCGIYGVADPTRADIAQYLRHVGWSHLASRGAVDLSRLHVVLGRVALFGRVRVGTAGWRAELARPLGLVLSERERLARARRLFDGLVQRYELPIIPEEEVRPP